MKNLGLHIDSVYLILESEVLNNIYLGIVAKKGHFIKPGDVCLKEPCLLMFEFATYIIADRCAEHYATWFWKYILFDQNVNKSRFTFVIYSNIFYLFATKQI